VVVFEAGAQGKRNEIFFANSENHSSYRATSSGKFGHPDQESRVSMRTGSKPKSTSYRPAGGQPTQQVHRTSTRSRQANKSVRCYNCNKLGHYAKKCYQAKARNCNNERQFNSSRRPKVEAPQTTSDVPRRNNYLQGNEQ
jgi:hypothetical protein